MTDAREKLWDLIDDNPTCMMVSAGGDGKMRGRPMHAIVEDGTEELLFYTRISSGKSEELGKRRRCVPLLRVPEIVGLCVRYRSRRADHGPSADRQALEPVRGRVVSGRAERPATWR